MTEEDIRAATFDSIPKEYREHIDSQYENDYRDMEEAYFLDAMLSYEIIDITLRTKRYQEKKPK